MNKMKIIVGIFAMLSLIFIARLSIAESEYHDLEIKPIQSAQTEVGNSPVVQSQVIQYRVVDTYTTTTTAQ